MLLEEHVERAEAAQHVLAQIGAVDAEDQVVTPASQQVALELAHPGPAATAWTASESIGSG